MVQVSIEKCQVYYHAYDTPKNVAFYVQDKYELYYHMCNTLGNVAF